MLQRAVVLGGDVESLSARSAMEVSDLRVVGSFKVKEQALAFPVIKQRGTCVGANA